MGKRRRRVSGELMQVILNVVIIGAFSMIQHWVFWKFGSWLLFFIFGILNVLMFCILAINVYHCVRGRQSAAPKDDIQVQAVLYKQMKKITEQVPSEVEANTKKSLAQMEEHFNALLEEIRKNQLRSTKALLREVDGIGKSTAEYGEGIADAWKKTDAEQGIESLKAEIAGVLQEMEAVRADVAGLSAELESVKTEIMQRPSVQEIQEIQNDAAEAMQEIEDIQNDAAEAMQEMEGIQNDAAEAMQEMEDIQSDAAEAMQEMESIQSDAAEAMQEMEDVQNDAAEVMQEMEDIRNDAAEAIQEMKEVPETVQEEEEPSEESKPALSIGDLDPSDANHQLSPEEIAALFAGIN